MKARGFTLVEVLVALLVLALMAGMAWQGVDGIVRARSASQAQLEQTLRLNTVLGQWQKDLASVQETGAVPALAFDGATLRLTRRTEEGVQVVARTLRPDNAGATWLRWTGPVATTSGALQDSWIQSQQLIGTEQAQLRTVSGLTGWQVYYFVGNAWANAQSTGDTTATPPAAAASIPAAAASAVIQPALPSGVRIVLNFAPGSGFSGPLTRDTLLGP
jgi:general secretion pathway protein J